AAVAAGTGCAEPSAFYRAFRKRRGRSPAEFREEALARGGGAG
ncbi:AraC family transcriptional regulator, partial [Burkholderia cenocepacia]|nr:AraC family transcriptional regulator [Burkholderia cenocepacia]